MNKMRIVKYIVKFLMLVLVFTACQTPESPNGTIQIAFMSDVHLQDVYGEFSDCSFQGIKNPVNGKYATIRTMASQLQSTRLFNENYFAFLAALDDVVERGVKYVVLPGDFSDDGQPINLLGLSEILDRYTQKHGVQFFLTTGNHDPVRPYYNHAGKKDFLGEGGMKQPVMSKQGLYRPAGDEHPVALSPSVAELGYKGISEHLGKFGLFPNNEQIYWETPFTSYNYESYTYDLAKKEGVFEQRFYEIPPGKFRVPDVSYLVEPVDGLWLLAIDANVYVPVDEPYPDEKNPNNYQGAGIGYNNVLTHKKHLMRWVEEVARKAEERNKILVAFSHYPMIDFHNGASPEIQNLLGKGKMQSYRVPSEEVAQVFADCGVKIHFAGHLHVNDTGLRTTSKGNTLVNVQVPSLAAYIPAYKLLSIYNRRELEVETVIVDSVPGFNEFFELYREEHDFLQNSGDLKVWNKDVLSSTNYLEFTKWHLKELVRLRFIPNEWSLPFGDFFMQLTGKELLVLSQFNQALEQGCEEPFSPEKIEKTRWENALRKAETLANGAGIDITSLENWKGEDILLDLYKLRNADELAFHDIGEKRLKAYRLIFRSFIEKQQLSENNGLQNQFTEFSKIVDKFMNGEPSVHLMIDLQTGGITNLHQSN